MDSGSVVGAEDALSLDQLREKLEKYTELLNRYDQHLHYLTDQVENSPESAIGISIDSHNFVKISNTLRKSEDVVKENLRKLEEQIENYDEENPDINSTEGNNNTNNRNDNPHNPDLPLPNENTDIPLYLKITIGIVAVALTSFLAIFIWESLPKKRDK